MKKKLNRRWLPLRIWINAITMAVFILAVIYSVSLYRSSAILFPITAIIIFIVAVVFMMWFLSRTLKHYEHWKKNRMEIFLL